MSDLNEYYATKAYHNTAASSFSVSIVISKNILSNIKPKVQVSASKLNEQPRGVGRTCQILYPCPCTQAMNVICCISSGM